MHPLFLQKKTAHDCMVSAELHVVCTSVCIAPFFDVYAKVKHRMCMKETKRFNLRQQFNIHRKEFNMNWCPWQN